MSDPVWPHRQQPTTLLCPWDSPGKNTGVGCHFLLQCMKVKSESEVTQSCPTLSDPTDYSPPHSSIHGILQARVLEWVAVSFSLTEYWGELFFPSKKKKKPNWELYRSGVRNKDDANKIKLQNCPLHVHVCLEVWEDGFPRTWGPPR